MKKINMKKIKFIHTLLLLLFITTATPSVYAQTGFEDDVDDEGRQTTPETPIDNLLLVGLAGGAIIGYTTLRKSGKLSS